MTSTFDIISFLKKAVSIGASDEHLMPDEHPVVRKNGSIIKIDMPVLTEEDIDDAISKILPKGIKSQAHSAFDLDFAYEIKGVSRFRVNLSRRLGKSALVVRNIPYHIKKIEELGLPVSMKQFAEFNNGIVLVTGPTGSGKSTTLAALIEHINTNFQKHIITVEDPIEFIFTGKKCMVSQRQVKIDTPSFGDGVKYAMRQDPDVILIGEIRDKETVESALKASETGHLVFATLHTNDAVQTINRVINMFEPQDRDFIRTQLASTLRGTIAQKLVPGKGGETRYPACEIMVVTPTIKDYIVKDKLDDIYDLVKKGSFNNMTTMNMSLFELYKNDLISQETALEYSDDDNELQQMFRGVFRGTSENRFSGM